MRHEQRKRCGGVTPSFIFYVLRAVTFVLGGTPGQGSVSLSVQFKEHHGLIGGRNWPRMLLGSSELDVAGSASVGYYYADISMVCCQGCWLQTW